MLLLSISFTFFFTLSTAVQIKLKVYPERDDPKSNLIWFNDSTADQWSQKLDNYIEAYRTPNFNQEIHDNFIQCDYDRPTTSDKACLVNTEKFNPCVNTNYFGYRRKKPCVFLELQRIDGWRPSFYNDSMLLPVTMPESLKNYIDLVTQEPQEWENLWLSCEGDTAADKELIGFVEFYPQPSYPGYLFPFTGQKHYLNPTVAVQFKTISLGIVVNVVCKVWGPGITLDQNKMHGVTTFQILID